MSEPQSKRQKTSVQYELLYHPGTPGRGEYVRLAFEASGTSFIDVAKAQKDGYSKVLSICDQANTGDDQGNPPAFAPPILRAYRGGKQGNDLVISQTPNILLYLGQKLGLVGSEDHHLYLVNGLALTALDLCNEAHDTHHPIANVQYYEGNGLDQKEAALEKSKDFKANRIPKYFSHFERVLKANETEGSGKHLVGSKLTYADTTLWQSLDGVMFAFPKAVEAQRKHYPLLFETFYTSLKQEKWLDDYLQSERRLPYSDGIYRHYPELDEQ